MKTIILAFLVSLTSCSQSDMDSFIAKHDLPFELTGNYKIINNTDNPSLIFAQDEKSKTFIKIKYLPIKNKDEAYVELKKNFEILFSQFIFNNVAFTGRESEGEKCLKKFSPKIQVVPGNGYITSFVDHRFALCICQANVPFLKKGTAFYADKKYKHFVMVEYFVSKYANDEPIDLFFKTNFTKMERLSLEGIEL